MAGFAASAAAAPAGNPESAPAADSVLLSEQTDGDYLVRRYMVKDQGDAAYSVLYQINLATLSSTLGGNTRELDQLNTFINQLGSDTLMKVRSVIITGYSSPDGPAAFNESLARRRAQGFRTYVDRKYSLSKRFDVTTRSVAEDWEMCRSLVAQSNIPDRQNVLRIIDSNRPIEAKETELKQLPAAWEYMKRNILPPLRRVELSINYGEGTVVEVRTRIRPACPEPAPKPEPAAAKPEQCCVVIDDTATGILVEMPESGREFRRDVRQVERAIDREERTVRDATRPIEELSGKEARAARKLARREARVARRMARAEAKAAQKSYKALERGNR